MYNCAYSWMAIIKFIHYVYADPNINSDNLTQKQSPAIGSRHFGHFVNKAVVFQ